MLSCRASRQLDHFQQGRARYRIRGRSRGVPGAAGVVETVFFRAVTGPRGTPIIGLRVGHEGPF